MNTRQGTCSVLIVDDNPSDREGIRELIAWDSLGMEVAGVATNGVEGLEKAIALKPDVILADVAMPLMNGLTMTRKIKEKLPETRVIFMSCFEDFTYAQSAISLEASGYVLKPINCAELTQVLEKVSCARTEEMLRIAHEDELRRKLKESLPLLQEQLMRDLAHGVKMSEAEIRERMGYLEMTCAGRRYSAIVVEIDEYDLLQGRKSIEEKYLLMYGLRRIVEETVLRAASGYILNLQYQGITVVLFHDPACADAGASTTGLLGQCRDAINRDLLVSVTIGVSHPSDRLSDLRDAVHAASQAVRRKFYTEGNQILTASDTAEHEEPERQSLRELDARVRSLVESGSAPDVAAFVERQFRPDRRLPPWHVKNLTFSIVTIVQSILLEHRSTLEAIGDGGAQVWEKLLAFELNADIRQWVAGILESARSHLERLTNSRTDSVVRDIKQIIETEYRSLRSINDIVRTLPISASHANLVFKRCTGKTIFAHLIDKRIGVARKLLEDPYCRISEVADQVGYENKSYFSLLFRQYTGMTPRQYSDRHAK